MQTHAIRCCSPYIIIFYIRLDRFTLTFRVMQEKNLHFLSIWVHIRSMITSRHIRAARGWLNWSQKDLAENASVSLTSVRRQEKEKEKDQEVSEKGRKVRAREASRQAVIRVLDAQGIEFKPNGIEQRDLSSYILDGYFSVLDDIEKALPDGGEVLKHCVDDRRSTPEIIEKVNQMRARGISERLTISEDNDFITGQPENYRQISKEYFSASEVILIYADKVAFFTEGKAIVVRSPFLSGVFRQQFEYWWEKGLTLHAT